MCIQHIDGKQIRRLTEQGIGYVDDEGKEQFIDFATCYENYLQKHISPEGLERIKKLNPQSEIDWEKWVDGMKQFRCVGDRNILTPPWADGPYIEFFTNPPIRFKFATEKAFQKVRNYIEWSGWRTGDRS